MNTTDLKDKLSTTAEKAKETVGAAIGAATEAGRTVAGEAKLHAADTFDTVRDAASDRAGAARDVIVEAGDRLSERLQIEAEGGTGVSSRVLGSIADGVATVTDGLRGRTLGDLVADARDYAKRNPGTFAVGAAVAGFAVARFLRSSGARMTAEARAADTTERLYRDAARRTVDASGKQNSSGPQS